MGFFKFRHAFFDFLIFHLTLLQWILQSDLVNLDQPDSVPQHILVKKKSVPLLENFGAALTFWVFGSRKSCWYLGTPTRGVLFISGVPLTSGDPGTPSPRLPYRVKVELQPYNYVLYHKGKCQNPLYFDQYIPL